MQAKLVPHTGQAVSSTARRYSRRTLIRRGATGASVLGLNLAGCRSATNSKSSSSSARPGSTAAVVATGPATKMTVSYDGVPFDVPLFLAKDQGIFAKRGLDVTTIQIAGPTSVAAVLSGQVQAGHSGGSEVLGAAVQGGNVKIVTVESPVFPFQFMSVPSITTPAELKGKKVGVSEPGGAADTALRIALPKLGLEPDKDVTFISVGSIANQVAGLQSGAIQGTIVVVGPDTVKMQNQGFRVLFDFANLDIPYADAVIEFSGSYIDANRSVVQRYVDSIIEATVLFKKDKAASLQELAKIYNTTDTTGFDVAYQFYTQDKVTVLPPTPKPDDFTNTVSILCKKVQQACNYDVSKVLDPSFVQNAPAQGSGT